MDIRKFLDEAKSYEEIVETIASLALDRSEEATKSLSDFLLFKDRHTYDKFTTPVIACRGLLSRGPEGVATLASLIDESDGVILPTAVVECLWYASHRELAPIVGGRQGLSLPDHLEAKPGIETASAAGDAFRDFVAKAQNSEALFDVLVHFMNSNNIKTYTGPVLPDMFRSDVFRILSESSIRISMRMLNDYERLLAKKSNEEMYQVFLTKNAVLLDPLASMVIPKQPLGLEFKTDYVIKRLDNQYFAVEIEKPQDLLFTKADDFSASFTHALGQVIDFLEWVDAHAAYARHHLPGISSPKGMLVMGMRTSLSPAQAAKLKRLAINTPNIDIVTFDDLLERGRMLYRNIHRSTDSL